MESTKRSDQESERRTTKPVVPKDQAEKIKVPTRVGFGRVTNGVPLPFVTSQEKKKDEV